jgi:hypothetical protein
MNCRPRLVLSDAHGTHRRVLGTWKVHICSVLASVDMHTRHHHVSTVPFSLCFFSKSFLFHLKLIVYPQANTEPLRLNYEVPTFPLFALARFPSLVSDLGLTSTSFIDAWNPTPGHFEQHMIGTVRVIEAGQRLLYKMRKSLLDGLRDGDCPGLDSELNLQSHNASASKSVLAPPASIPPSTPIVSSSGAPVSVATVPPPVVPPTVPYTPSTRMSKRPAIDIPDGQAPPSKYFISESYNHSNSYDDDDERFESHADNSFAPGPVPVSSSAATSTALPPLHTTSSSLADAVRSPTLSTPLTARPAGLQTAPAHSSHVTHTTHSSPHTPSAHVPRIRHGAPKPPHQALTTYVYGPPTGSYSTSSELGSSSASSTASSSTVTSSNSSAISSSSSSSSSSSTSTPPSPIPQYLLSSQLPTYSIPYHAHPPMKRWPNDFTVSEITRGFRHVDALVANVPAFTQRAAFERVFGCRYVKSTVCRHRGVWRRADVGLRKRFEDMGDGVEAAMWGEFVRKVEGKPTMLEGNAAVSGDVNGSGSGNSGGGGGGGGSHHHHPHNHQSRQQHHSPHPQSQSGNSGHSGHHRSVPREAVGGNAYDAEDEDEMPPRPPGLAPVFTSSGSGDGSHTSHANGNGGGSSSVHGHSGHGHNSSSGGNNGHSQSTHSGGHGQGHHQNLMVHSGEYGRNVYNKPPSTSLQAPFPFMLPDRRST